MSLSDDLAQGELRTRMEYPCPPCIAIREAAEEDKALLTRAFAGTIGVNKLVEILAKNGVTANGAAIGRRTIYRHREEEHTP